MCEGGMCEGGMVRVSCVWISERVCMCEGVHVSKSEWKDMGRAERSLTGEGGRGRDGRRCQREGGGRWEVRGWCVLTGWS